MRNPTALGHEYNARSATPAVPSAKPGPPVADYVSLTETSPRPPFCTTPGIGTLRRRPLKNNLPELFPAAQKAFLHQAPHQVFCYGKDGWKSGMPDDFDPWETLRWETVRVVRYPQHKPDAHV